MGQILIEDQLEFDFRAAITSTRFDDEATHGLSHCMKRVDFLVLSRLPQGKARIYIVIIACAQLLSPELLTLTDKLKRQLPLVGPFQQAWSQPYFDACFVTNFAEWNRALRQFPLRRIP